MMHRRTTSRLGHASLLALILLTLLPSLVMTPAQARQAEALGQRQVYLPFVSRSAPPPTSEEIIDAALERGEIDAEAALTYKVFATFEDRRLPAQYRGAPSLADDSLILNEVIAGWQNLSSEARATLEPFLIPPMYAGSWWQRRYALSKGIRLQSSPPDSPMSDEWSFIDTKNGKAKVWWQSKLHPEDKAKAQQLADAIDAPIWLALSTLMGREPLPDKRFLGVYWGGDERLDIALVDLSRSVTSGLNYMQCDANPAHIQFNRTKNADELAHEMMHAIQLSYDVVRGCPATDYRWLMESTAEWVKDYVYPSMQGEHPFAPRYLDQPQLPLNTKNDDHEYGAYLFSFYLARRYNQPQLIRAMWDNTTRFGSLEAVDAAIPGGFKDRWPEFALYNWNALPGPYDSYQRWDQLSHRAMPETGWAFPVVLNGGPGARIKLAEDVAHLSTKYYHFAFPEDAARTVTFYNGFDYKLSQQALITGKFDAETLMWEPVDESVKRGGNIRALIKIGGKWQLQDWTNQPYRSFCRDRSDERVEEMVLIFSNSVYDPAYVLEPQGLPSTLTVSNIGCWRYQGQSSYKGTLKTWMGVELQMTGETSTQDAIWERQPLQVMEDGSGASYIGPSTFAPVAGTIYTDWTSTGDCGNLGSGSARRQGSGAVSPGNGLNALEVLSHSVGGVDHRGYAGEASSDTMVPQSRTGCLASLPEEEAIGEWFLVRSSWQDRVGPDGKVISGSHTNTSDLGTLYYTWCLTALRQP